MSIVTTKPRGSGLSRFAPSNSYEGIASKYAANFQAALSEEKKLELQTKVQAYSTGGMKWEELRKYLEDQISSEGESTWGLYLKQQLASLQGVENSRQKETKRATLEADAIKSGNAITAQERYNIEAEMLKYEAPGTKEYVAQQQRVIDSFDNAQTEQVLNKRAELIKAAGRDGNITKQEELMINLALQKEANPNSKIYKQLVDQEVNLRQEAANAGRAAGASSSRDALDQMFATFETNQKIVDQKYQEGTITGAQKDAFLFDEAKKLLDAVTTARQQGANVSASEYKTIYEGTIMAKNQLQARQNGLILDVADKSGKLASVTLQTLANDENNPNPQYVRRPVEATFDPLTGGYNIIDPATGKKVNPVPMSQTQANAFIKEKFPSWGVAVQTDKGRENWNYNQNTGTFSPQSDPKRQFALIPQNEEQRTKFEYRNMSPQQIAKTQVGFMTNLNAGKIDLTKPETLPNLTGTAMGPDIKTTGQVQAKSKGLFGDITTAIGEGARSMSTAGQVSDFGNVSQNGPTNLDKITSAIGPTLNPILSGIEKNAGSFGNTVGATLSNSLTSIGKGISGFFGGLGNQLQPNDVKPVNAAGPGSFGPTFTPSSGFNLPDIKIPQVQIPSFSLPSFNLPEIKPFNFLSTGDNTPHANSNGPQVNGPSFNLSSVTKPVGDFLGGAFNTVKNFFGF